MMKSLYTWTSAYLYDRLRTAGLGPRWTRAASAMYAVDVFVHGRGEFLELCRADDWPRAFYAFSSSVVER